jgi:putative restriction endonuclease
LDGPSTTDANDLTLPEFRRARETGRDARFKNAVVGGYRFTCALTGYRLVTADQGGIVEAAHIHALSSSRNNDPDNGLALTPTAHALFDRGVWSVDEGLRVIVRPAAAFIEESPPGGFSLRALAGRPLHFAKEASLRPARPHFAWHRRQHGFA